MEKQSKIPMVYGLLVVIDVVLFIFHWRWMHKLAKSSA